MDPWADISPDVFAAGDFDKLWMEFISMSIEARKIEGVRNVVRIKYEELCQDPMRIVYEITQAIEKYAKYVVKIKNKLFSLDVKHHDGTEYSMT